MNSVNGINLRKMFEGGFEALGINRQAVDELNVFPVPDGDTGTNMYLTISSAINFINEIETDDVSELATAYSKGAFEGARGNSGVITSQIMKGFAVALNAKEEMTVKDLANAMKSGTEIAYDAIKKPQEGTILTVIRVMAETAQAQAKKRNTSIELLLEKVIEAGKEILAKTPEMLPVLAKAGVVDAGGTGILTVFEGFYAALTGTEIRRIPCKSETVSEIPQTQKSNVSQNLSLDNDYENITFQYCTEFFVTHLNRTTTATEVDKFRDYLMTIGDCVLVIYDTDRIKVHVHTNKPNLALGKGLTLGELDKLKIENMMEQHRKIYGEKPVEEEKGEPKEYAMVAIAAGDGITQIFKDLLVDQIVEGGQTMNPSVYDILNAINKTNAKHIFVFPNNSNIILAANQAKELTDSDVRVIPTTCIPEGISAALVMNPELSADENELNMLKTAKNVKSAEVTHAVRNTKMNGFNVKEGDIIGIANKKIVAKSGSVAEAAIQTASKIIARCEILTLYYGNGITEDEAMALCERLQIKFPDIEVTAYYGGQQHYYYVLSAE